MKPIRQLFAVSLTILALSAPCSAQDDDAKADAEAKAKAAAEAKAAEDRTEAIKKFTKQLSGSTLVGQFTLDDAPAEQSMKPDRYQIATVNHISGDTYLFVYLHKGVPIPLSLKVLWAGDTPMIVLDDFTIAGMGTFSSRVMFHGDRYAGTWQHGKKGGLMFGKIEKPKAPQEPAEKAKPDAKPAGKSAE
ncbi:MAG: hypothetical protein O2820_08105 [Planctomycetota bacterium]|nr:hypothetical protein [Planctomycetota bacterium]MDA1249174.1 hypothetical protein [Planctomycetota bacterium]